MGSLWAKINVGMGQNIKIFTSQVYLTTSGNDFKSILLAALEFINTACDINLSIFNPSNIRIDLESCLLYQIMKVHAGHKLQMGIG